MLMGRHSTEEVIEARAAVEVELAGFAAARADESALAELAAQLEEMRRSREDPAAYTEADVRFHLEVAHAAGNRVLLHVVQTLQQIVRAWITEVVNRYEQGRPASFEEHERIYAAIRAHDVTGARQAMAEHLRIAADRLRAVAGYDVARESIHEDGP
jgi:GntR family transcriptional repressor for pyruvate dehydrogenase complex